MALALPAQLAFARELAHPHIARVLDSFAVASGEPAIVFELMPCNALEALHAAGQGLQPAVVREVSPGRAAGSRQLWPVDIYRQQQIQQPAINSN